MSSSQPFDPSGANLLALDTSTDRAAVALLRRDDQRFVAPPDVGRRHGRALVPALRDLLAGAKLMPEELHGIAVGLGPGSYTGLRIGLTAAKTLAYATGCVLVGLDSLEAIAAGAPEDALRVAVVVDAQRGGVYAEDFEREAPGAPLLRVRPSRVLPSIEWLASLTPGTVVIGPDLHRLRIDWPADLVRFPLDPQSSSGAGFPQPLALIEMARRAWTEGRREDPWALEPIYLRRSGAEEKAETR